jgi:hypothetical protein
MTHTLENRSIVRRQTLTSGTYDPTISHKVGEFGCARSSMWISDTGIECALNPGKSPSDVTIEAVQSMVICSKCEWSLVLDGCIQGQSPGDRQEC